MDAGLSAQRYLSQAVMSQNTNSTILEDCLVLPHTVFGLTYAVATTAKIQ